MDWRQFAASLIGSLAWPSVAIVLMFLCRKQLVHLAGRIEQFDFFGAKASFKKELDAGREASEQLPDGGAVTFRLNIEEVADEAPEEAIVLSYRELERVLLQIRAKLDLSRANLPTILKHLVEKKMVPPAASEVFNRLRNAKEAIKHFASELTPPEAREYVDQAVILRATLMKVLADLEKTAAATKA